MDSLVWDVPQNEDGFERVLILLRQYRERGDDRQVAWGLLRLSHLVKWVGSDNDEPPFQRSATLANEALAIFRRLGDPEGQGAALRAACPFAPPEQREAMLAEAERLARESGDERGIARSLAARARSLALSDSEAAGRLNLQALEIFRRLGEVGGQARCLFSLSITHGTEAEKLRCAREAADLFRSLGDPGAASQSLTIALMNAADSPVAERERMALQGLADAQAAQKVLQEQSYYRRLAAIAQEKGDLDSSARYLRWCKELEEVTRQSDLERNREAQADTEEMIALTRRNGNAELAHAFQQKLDQLRHRSKELASNDDP